MDIQKGLAPIAIILIIAGVLIIGGGVWRWQSQKGKPVAEQSAIPNLTSTSSIDISPEFINEDEPNDSQIIKNTLRLFSDALIANDEIAAQNIFSDRKKSINMERWRFIDQESKKILGQIMAESIDTPPSIMGEIATVKIKITDGESSVSYGSMTFIEESPGFWKVSEW